MVITILALAVIFGTVRSAHTLKHYSVFIARFVQLNPDLFSAYKNVFLKSTKRLLLGERDDEFKSIITITSHDDKMCTNTGNATDMTLSGERVNGAVNQCLC